MKIENVSATACSKDFSGVSMSFGVGNNVKRDLVLVKVVADDGTVGYGEAHHALAPTAIAEIINHSLAPLVEGCDAMDREGVFDRIFKAQIQTHGTGTAAAIAASGIDIALWDLAGKILGRPVYELLGGTRKPIRAYVGGLSLGFKPLDDLEKEVAGYVAQGYTAIKLRVGESAKEDAERVGHIRRTFGDDLDIAVDAGTRYDFMDIRDVADYCERYRVYWLEEPFTPDNAAAYAEMKRHTSVPLAAGENHFTKQTFRELLAQGTISIFQADCTKAGGLSEVRKIADMAAACHFKIAPHTSQSILSSAANLHLLAAVPNGLIYEADLAPINPFRDELATNPPVLVDGCFEPPAGPGLGLDVDETIAQRYPGIAGPLLRPKKIEYTARPPFGWVAKAL